MRIGVQGRALDVGGPHAVAEDHDPDRGRHLDQDLAQPLRAEIEAERILAELPADDPEADPAQQDQEQHGHPQLAAVAQHPGRPGPAGTACRAQDRRPDLQQQVGGGGACAPSSTQIAVATSSRPAAQRPTVPPSMTAREISSDRLSRPRSPRPRNTPWPIRRQSIGSDVQGRHQGQARRSPRHSRRPRASASRPARRGRPSSSQSASRCVVTAASAAGSCPISQAPDWRRPEIEGDRQHQGGRHDVAVEAELADRSGCGPAGGRRRSWPRASPAG